jgi:phage shock protein PspC (stress-responsive transcriptional regulator)
VTRSFTDRVFGGVCGGLPGPSWAWRLVWGLLTPLTLGLAGLAYVLLWWFLPQESLITARRGAPLRLILSVGILAVLAVAFIGRDADWLEGPTGESLFWPVVLLLTGGVYMLRQVRA